jgi:predicted DNA-binding transcriptional regulator AlpA
VPDMSEQVPTLDDLLPYAEGRRLFGVTAMTLWRWRRKQGMPAPIKIGNRLYFSRRKLEEWLAKQRIA